MKNTKYTVNPDNRFSFEGFLEENIRFIEDFQLKDKALWKRFSDQFKIHSDDDNGWRGEYWGKMMRGACYVYSYTQDAELYDTLSQSVKTKRGISAVFFLYQSFIPREKKFSSSSTGSLCSMQSPMDLGITKVIVPPVRFLSLRTVRHSFLIG